MEKKYADKISHMEKVLERIDFNESYTDGCVRRQRALEGFMDDTNTYASPEFAFYYYEEVKIVISTDNLLLALLCASWFVVKC